mmetsp:Transcript_16057/g.53973  ORF Transcript_16057/g.53973 Transcript_16057/m.53973 type:complete len:222 (+) Transcript_16057:217-882(+)
MTCRPDGAAGRSGTKPGPHPRNTQPPDGVRAQIAHCGSRRARMHPAGSLKAQHARQLRERLHDLWVVLVLGVRLLAAGGEILHRRQALGVGHHVPDRGHGLRVRHGLGHPRHHFLGHVRVGLEPWHVFEGVAQLVHVQAVLRLARRRRWRRGRPGLGWAHARLVARLPDEDLQFQAIEHAAVGHVAGGKLLLELRDGHGRRVRILHGASSVAASARHWGAP